MGTVMKADNSSCIVPPPTTPTPRPVPTMAAQVKSITGGMSKGASSLIIVFLTITLVLFLIFRVFTPSRVIHMCEEVTSISFHKINDKNNYSYPCYWPMSAWCQPCTNVRKMILLTADLSLNVKLYPLPSTTSSLSALLLCS